MTPSPTPLASSFDDAAPGTRVAVTGAGGLVGSALVPLLRELGYEVLPVSRMTRDDAARAGQDVIAWDPAAGWIDEASLSGVDAAIHLAGEPIGRRFTAAHKIEVLRSRVESTTLLAETLARFERPKTLITASAIGYYGAQPHRSPRGASSVRADRVMPERRGPLREDHAPGQDFLAGVCVAWENAASAARDAGMRVAHVRTGVVLSPRGGVLGLQLPLFHLGLGGPLSDGWLSWIALDDLVGIYVHALQSPAVTGPVNAVAPHPVTGGEFASTLGRVLRRPAIVPVPSFGPALLLGTQGARELALASQYVSSATVEGTGYAFQHRTLEDALRHML